MVDKFFIDYIAFNKDDNTIMIDNCIIKAKSRIEALLKLSARIYPAQLVKVKVKDISKL